MEVFLKGRLGAKGKGKGKGDLEVEGTVELHEQHGDQIITASTFKGFLQNTLENMVNANGVILHVPDHVPGAGTYTMPEVVVGGSVLQDFKRYRLVPKPDMTAHELFVLTLILYDKVRGNMIACLLENGLARHLEEVE